jgi:penicillin-binding protein 1C
LIKKVLKLLLAAALCLTGIWLLRFAWLPLAAQDPQPFLQARFASGGAYLDRYGTPLRLYPDNNGDFYCYAPLASHSRHLRTALLTAEDRSFFSHPGFDLQAIMRAAWQNLTNLRIISGASTISQQLIRIVNPRPRNLSTKIAETLSALRLEQKHSKNQILEYYFNSVPMFGNIRGFYLASLLLFNKTPDLLNIAEAATLVAIVQSPGRLTPFSLKGNKRLRQRRDWVLREMLKLGYCTKNELSEALEFNIPSHRRQMPFNAPHFCDLLEQVKGTPVGNTRTTVSLPLQNRLCSILRSHLPRLARSGARQTCAMIVDNQSMGIMAMVGSAEFGPLNAGYNNGCLARRSGGSILKPFLYGLALEKGYYPSYVIPDTMQPFKTPQGEYLPFNANRRAYGPVTIRNALGNSLNISAVKMLNLVGINDFFALLVELEILQNTRGAADYYGLGLAIGNPEVRMLDVVRAYSIFAGQGRLKNLTYLPADGIKENQVISKQTAYLIYDMLSDPAARLLTFGNPQYFNFKQRWALKTGTSTNYRDSWLLAFNHKYVFGIWVGNFDGSPTRNLSGAGACGPIAQDIIEALPENAQPIQMPAQIQRISVCSISGQLPGPNCRQIGKDLFYGDLSQLPRCTFHKKNTDRHELSADYARWLQKRSIASDFDPFKLSGTIQPGDPFKLVGIDNNGNSQQGYATTTIRVTADYSPTSFNSIKIVAPHENDRFILSQGKENFLYMRAIPERPTSEIVWLINGREYIRVGPPFEVYWPMEPGRHRITAIGEGQAAAEVNISIEN